ncbi:toxin-antitoxin system YwqK family antitoxin [Hymenobacter yonginensis]|uniref:Toxin-antitoxin system YwqK family antitoxin n=1 Tax=Hymenobacter yonginensis TaxID=748197 RepID=A0ABY7PN14_9BACT|nr:hypothetical protein [Hymenobacter yonginensis]WBO84022.1 hypothetical protein O9Z63_16785 [Hymenobacter yonginensis]
MNRYCYSLLLLFCFSLGPARAQTAALPKAKLNDCYRVVGKDSVVFYYSDEYVLTPPGCATIRRHVRLDSAGRFQGFVRDYRLTNNVLLVQGAYRAGRKEGLFEIYHPNGELATRGRYLQGREVGDWAYWYPTGRPRQILSFRDGRAPLIQQFWDETGTQLVKDGNGTWYRNELGLNLSGAVLQGAPDGRWVLRRLANDAVVVREIFRKGYFSSGVVVDTLETYQDESRLEIADWDAYSQGEVYTLSKVCQ